MPQDESVEEWYLEALVNYFQGDEWRDTLRVFISSHCRFFADISSYLPQQHAVWRSFQDVAEAVIALALQSLGGSLEQLEAGIDQLCQRRARGPRDAVIQQLLQQLQTVEDFELFATRMHDVCDEACRQAPYALVDHPATALMKMGFGVEQINNAYDKLGKEHASLEQLLQELTDYDEDIHTSVAQSTNSNQRYRDVGNKPGSALALFAAEAQLALGHALDVHELETKFTVAESVLESYHNGNLALSGGEDKMQKHLDKVDLVKWATDMQVLRADIDTAYEQEIPCADMCFNHPSGLIDWYQQLEARRQEMNDAAVAGVLLSDAELQRMAELDRIAAAGSEDEQRLHQLLSTHEALRKDIHRHYQQCSVMVSAQPGMRRHDVEELYLFLKDGISGAESAALSVIVAKLDQHPTLSSLVHTKAGMGFISLLLDLQLLEEQQQFIRKEIYQLVGSPMRIEKSSGFTLNEDESKDFGEMLDHFGATPDAGGNDGSWPSFAADEKQYDDKIHSGNRNEKAALSTSSAEAKLLLSAPSGSDKMAPTHGRDHDGKTSRAHENHDKLLQQLKEGHRDALEHLKTSLDLNRQKKCQALEDRLMRLKMRKSSAGDDAMTLQEVENALQLVGRELEETVAACDVNKAMMTEALKLRCLQELKAVRSALHAIDPAISNPSAVLTGEVQELAKQEASKAWRERYEQERHKLDLSLEEKRRQQREQLEKALQRRRQKRLGSASKQETLAAEEEDQRWLAAEQEKADQMLREALAISHRDLQDQLLLGLAAINVNMGELGSVHRSPNALADYLDDEIDVRRKQHQHILQWLDNVDDLRHSYERTHTQLQRLLAGNGAQRTYEDAQEHLSLVSDLVHNAFAHHLQDMEEPAGTSSKQAARQDRLQERIKAEILEAYESAKHHLDAAQRMRQEQAKGNLASRLAGRHRKDGDGSGADPYEQALEAAIDDFLSPSAATEQPSERVDRSFPQHSPRVAVRVVGGNAQETSAGRPTFDAHNVKTKDEILKQYNEREKALTETLQASMQEKKRRLEERIQQKRMAGQSPQASAVPGTADSKDALPQDPSEVQELQRRLQELERAYEQVVGMVKSGQAVNAQQATQILDHLAPEPTSATPRDSSTADASDAANADQHALVDHARRISMAFAEEQQRLDLMMKLQQTKQKQALQRKLFERSQARAQQQLDADHGAAASQPSTSDLLRAARAELKREDADDAEEEEEESDRVQIAPFRSNLARARMGGAQQQIAARGLDFVPRVAEPRGKDMALRGLHLQPMMSRK